MAAAPDNELLDAFLVEAGELLDALGEQLIQLEVQPRDAELLNAVFRVFHTVKGGAGFLSVTPMVGLCHHAEDLLNEARNGRTELQPSHVDHLLQALDVLQDMMHALRNGQAPGEPPAELMQRLQQTASAAAAPEPVVSAASTATADPVEDAFEALLDAAREPQPATAIDAAGEAIDDDEFEALLDQLHGDGRAPGAVADAGGDGGHIGEDEFETLLDELHGQGNAPGRENGGDERIDDSEFEALLDSIYGKGGAPGKPGEAESAKPDADAPEPPTATPAPVQAATPATAPPTTAPAAAATRPAPAKAAASADTTVRVDTGRLDALVNAAGELVLVRNRLATLTARSTDPSMERAVADLDRVAGDLQMAVLRMRMQPIGRLFQRFPRIVRDLARQLGKDVALVQEGEDTDLDRTLVEALADPLIHLLRNAVDHGLEDADTREREGKPRQGTVRLSAGQEGERIVIAIADDGRGMDPDVLRRKAVEKGLLDAERARLLEPAECYELIFMPGFSTRSEISDISGRGVGMDVVKTSVAALGGTIAIESAIGRGTTLRIGIPLTLAIMRVLMVRVGPRLQALPLANVAEVFELADGQMRSLDGRVVAAHRGRPLPLSDLAAWAGVEPGATARRHVVVVHIGHQRLGLLVDEVFGREEVMVKPLGSHLQHLPGIAGATITGDGRVALVLDLVGLAASPLPPPLRTTA